MPRLRIDNHTVEVEPGSTILEAARSVAVEIPTMCYLEDQLPRGSCMICAVKVRGASALLPACAARAEDGLAEMRQQVAQAVQDFSAALAGRSQAIARKARSLIPEGAVVVTHSHSGTVEETLLFVGRQDPALQVICSESRPMNEGKVLAARLASAGISVTLVADAALGTVCHEADHGEHAQSECDCSCLAHPLPIWPVPI